MKSKLITLIRIMILIFTIPVIMGLDEDQIPSALLLLLLIALNVQIRGVFLKDEIFILSLMVDLILIYLLYNAFGGFSYLPILITAFDGILHTQEYDYAITLLTGIIFLYFSYGEGFQLQLISTLVFLMTAVFGFFYKAMSRKVVELENTYDDARKYSYQLEVAKNQISTYSQQVEHLASVKERQRISEEIHDTIGHRLTALLMQMEAGIRLLDKDFSNGKDFLKAAVENLRESIDVLRQTVRSTMPKEYKNLILSFEEMIRRFNKDTGINIELQVKGEIIKLYPGVEMVLYKNAQEAITNAVRHGGAKNIYIHLIYEGSEVILEVGDDGKGCQTIKKGIGISSMEERLKFVGGHLEIVKSNGFVIRSIVAIEGKIT